MDAGTHNSQRTNILRTEIVKTGWPHTLENRENRENGEKKFPAGKNQGI